MFPSEPSWGRGEQEEDTGREQRQSVYLQKDPPLPAPTLHVFSLVTAGIHYAVSMRWANFHT